MTLPLSGPLEASDINVELGRSATAVMSIKDAATGVYGAINTCSIPHPNGTAPHSYSEWYGYNHNAICLNSYYAMSDGQTGTYNGLYSDSLSYDTTVSTTKPDPANGVCSWSFWFKPVTTEEVQGTIYKLHVDVNNSITIYWLNNESITTPGVYYNYISFFYAVDDGVNPAGSIDSECNVSDANNSTISGVSDSSPWGIGNYGNVDTNDYVLITIVIDAAQVGTNDFVKWYWNDTQMNVPYAGGSAGNSFTNADGLISPDWTDAVMYIGGTSVGDIPASWSQLDAFAIYNNTAISPGDVTSIYNGGAVNTIGNYQGISTDLLYYNFESDSPNLGIDTASTYDFFLDEYNAPTRVNDPAL
jgi:hypothetical protein